MTTELYDLELDEVSLVPAGDDPLAKVAIIKRRDVEKVKEIEMTDEMKAKLKPYMDKGMSEEDAKSAYEADLEKEKEVAKLKAENEALRGVVLKEGYRISAEGIEKSAPEDMIEVEGEMIAKSAIPAPVLKALEAAAVAKQDKLVTEKAQNTLPNFDEAVAKSFMGMDLSEEMLAALIAADALFGGMTEEVGETKLESSMKSAQEKLDEMVAKVATEKTITKYAAYDEVAKTKEGKALITAVYKKEV